MPFYDFKCKKCGNIKNDIIKHVDNLTPEICDVCGENMEIIIGAPFMKLVGNGWTKQRKWENPKTKKENINESSTTSEPS